MPTVQAAELRAILEKIYQLNGVSSHEAEIVSRHQVDANLAGHDSHGVMRTLQYVTAIKAGSIVPGAKFVVEQETPTTAVIDGNWGFGFVMTEQAMALAISKAKDAGTAAVTIRFQGHVGRLGAYAGSAAEQGYIAMMMADSGRGPKITAPPGAKRALLGSNPICMGVPSARHGAVVLDMATSAVALGKVQLARARGEQVPAGWIVDSEGKPTTNPDDYWAGGALLPLGGDQAHKGYGLSFMVEIFCGLLTGLGYGVAADGRHNDGNFIAVYDTAKFMDPEHFKEQVSDFIDYLRDGAREGAEVLYPGEMEQRNREAQLRDGIVVEDKTWAALTELQDAG